MAFVISLAVVIRSILFFISVPDMLKSLVFVALFLILYSVLTVCQTNSKGFWFIFTVYSLFAVKCSIIVDLFNVIGYI
jgi:hypothetical protein